MDRTKIAIIIPYFGKFPGWIDLYLFSCSKNSFIDFWFFTDCDIPHKVYKNTFFKKITFKEYCEQVSHALGITFAPENPYKLCDLKVFYGIIHENLLKEYDFWGFGDLDLMYGDLSLIINENKLGKYELITTHADRIAGHFTIIKKNSKFTTLCYKIENWKSKLEDERGLGVDEHDFTWLVHPFQKQIWRFHRILSKIIKIHPYKFFEIFNNITNLFTKYSIREYYTSPLPENGESWIYDIKKNTIINPDNIEIPYLHFLFFKKTPFRKTDYYWREDFYQIDKSYINDKGFIIINNHNIRYKDEYNTNSVCL